MTLNRARSRRRTTRIAYPTAAPNWKMEVRRITATVQRLREALKVCSAVFENRAREESVDDCLGNNASSYAEQLYAMLGQLERPTDVLLAYLKNSGKFSHLKEHTELYQARLNNLDRFYPEYQEELRLRDIGAYTDEEHDSNYEFTRDVKPVLNALEMIPAIVQDFRRFSGFVAAMADHIEHVNRVAPFDDQDEIVPLGVEPVEIMWHATTAYREIISGGFKTKDELGRNVAGLGGAVEGISFTASRDIAEGIADAITDLVRLLHGDLTRDQLSKYGKEIGLSDSVIAEALDRLDRKFYYDHTLPLDAENFFRVFQYLLFKAGSEGLRYDPLFFGLDASIMATVDQSNIGIVEARIDTTKANRYLRSMEEWRVPKEAIVSFGPVGSQRAKQVEGMMRRTAKWERYNIAAEAAKLNRQHFSNDLDLDFPMVYQHMLRMFGKAAARRYRGSKQFFDFKITISNSYNMSYEQFIGILAHELVHIEMFQRGFDEAHGYQFMEEVRRLRNEGLNVPLSEDVPEMEMDAGKPFAEPIWVAVADRDLMTSFRRVEDAVSMERLINFIRRIGKKRMELFKTTNPQVRRLPIMHGLRGRLKLYKLDKVIYDALRPDLVKSFDLTK